MTFDGPKHTPGDHKGGRRCRNLDLADEASEGEGVVRQQQVVRQRDLVHPSSERAGKQEDLRRTSGLHRLVAAAARLLQKTRPELGGRNGKMEPR